MSNGMQKMNTTFWLEELKRITKTHRAILSSPWYINLAPLGPGSWEQYWSVEPLAFSADIDQKDRVLGGEAAAWGEHIDATNSISSTWPLAAAVGERLWSPASLTDKSSAKRRIHRVRCRMVARGIPAAPTEPSECPLIYPDEEIVQHDKDNQVSVF
jgi:hexosaminidase